MQTVNRGDSLEEFSCKGSRAGRRRETNAGFSFVLNSGILFIYVACLCADVNSLVGRKSLMI